MIIKRVLNSSRAESMDVKTRTPNVNIGWVSYVVFASCSDNMEVFVFEANYITTSFFATRAVANPSWVDEG